MSLIGIALLLFNLVVLDILIFINYTLLQRDWKMGAEDKLANPDYSPMPYNEKGYSTFGEFYPYYLGEHHNQINRRLHIVGTSNGLAILATTVATGCYPLALAAVAQGYALAWVGHFFFEKNKPATFSHPFYSFAGDFRLWWEVISGQRKF